MPSILQINVTANWGSTGKIAEQIGQTAMRHGWDSYIAYGRMINPSKSQLIKVGSQLDVYSHYAVGRVLDAEGLLSKRATIQLVKTMEEIKPDVVHLHNIHDHYLNYPVLFRYLAARDIPVMLNGTSDLMEYVCDGKNAFVLKDFMPASITEGIIRVCDLSGEELDNIKRNAMKTGLGRFDYRSRKEDFNLFLQNL